MATHNWHWIIMGKSENRHLQFTISLQVFWQNFYRNVPWVVLYQIYLFCYNLWIWLVTIATKKQNLWNKYLKINSSGAVWGIKLKLYRIVSYIGHNKKELFFITVVQALWYLKVSIDLQLEKWKLRFTAISMQIYFDLSFTEIFVEWSSTKHIISVQTSHLVLIATLNFQWLITGKMKIGIYCYFIADILTKAF